MKQTTGRGRYTAADAYPYLAGQTGLAALIIPAWAQDGGREVMLKRFADHATFDDPMRESDGVRVVVVNGRIALIDGRPTGEQAGRTLLRSSHMPSRPMTAGARRLRLEGVAVQQARVSINIAQGPGMTVAAGTFRLSDPTANISMDMKEFGLLQVAGEWASVTGRAKLRGADEERSIMVIVDRQDPMANGLGTILVEQVPLTGSPVR
jgi:hypothetical protein